MQLEPQQGAPLQPPQDPPEPPVLWVCPMDPDVRGKGPGKCAKCGMALEPGIRAPVEYPVSMQFNNGEIRLRVLHPETGKPVRRFQVVHEKLFHLFLVGQDLDYFAHEHPQLGSGGVFRFRPALPKPGLYRLLLDFYPEGGTPQMIPKTLITGPPGSTAKLERDLSVKRGGNLEVTLSTEPPEPIAAKKTLLFFSLTPADGLEQYLGAWGHLLAASDDLVDLIHAHPAIADGGPVVQFNVIFPREAVYRIWVQFQRQGKVTTAAFTVPVSHLK